MTKKSGESFVYECDLIISSGIISWLEITGICYLMCSSRYRMGDVFVLMNKDEVHDRSFATSISHSPGDGSAGERWGKHQQRDRQVEWWIRAHQEGSGRAEGQVVRKVQIIHQSRGRFNTINMCSYRFRVFHHVSTCWRLSSINRLYTSPPSLPAVSCVRHSNVVWSCLRLSTSCHTYDHRPQASECQCHCHFDTDLKPDHFTEESSRTFRWLLRHIFTGDFIIPNLRPRNYADATDTVRLSRKSTVMNVQASFR